MPNYASPLGRGEVVPAPCPRFWWRLALRVGLPSTAGIVLLCVALFAVVLPAVKQSLMEQRRNTARELTTAVVTILEGYRGRVLAGELDRQQAQQRAQAHIRHLRYGDDLRDYFWISDTNAQMVMHPYRNDLEQKDLSGYRDPSGKRPFVEMARLVEREGGGFIDYMWQWKDDPTRVEPKVSHVQLFEPWDWIVGTGIYVEDALAEIREVTRRVLIAMLLVLVVVTLLSTFIAWQSFQFERRRYLAEQELRESERSLATLMSNLPGLVYRCRNDRPWTFEFVSEGCKELTGYRPEALIGSRDLSYAQVIDPEDREAVWQQVQEAVQAHEPFVIKYRLRTADGDVRWVRERGRGVFDGDQLVALEGFVTDITAQHEAAEERKVLQEALHQSQKMEAVGQLAAGVAHDFNNLLTVMLGSVERLREDFAPSDDVDQALSAIEQAAEQATGVTRSLLTFSHKLPTRKRSLRLGDAVERGTRLLTRFMPASIRLDVDHACREPLWVDVDPTQLQQVLINLAINARDAMPTGGTLSMRVRPATHAELERLRNEDEAIEAAATLCVSDSGAGMPPEVRERIFEPFFTTKPRGSGTGLGLAIVHGIVRDHGGCIDVESAADAGTTFTLVLPCLPSTDGSTARVSNEPCVQGRGELIALGEDHAPARELMATRLRTLGYRVLAFGAGDALVATCRQHGSAIQLYVLDVDMPGLDGLGCLAEIRQWAPRSPVLIISGGIDRRLAALGGGVTDVLRKPFTMLEFGQRVAQALGGVPGEVSA